MQNKKNMSIALSVVICLALVGFLVFISLNKEEGMNPNNTNTNVSAEVAKTGDTVSMNYTGRLQSGTVFDSNVDPKFGHAGQPLIFTLGAGQMIPGFDKGVIGMKVGEKKTLTLSPEEAYGAEGRPPVIPQNSTLIFDVELVSIIK